MSVNPSRKHLVLLGAGRAHLHVLKSLARQGAGDMAVTLVAPHPYYIESAMLPGYIAGDYTLEDVRIPLDRLVEASGVGFVPAHVISLDPAARRVQLSSGDALPYDVLSVNVEPAVNREEVEAQMPGARRNALFTHPLENFVQLWPQLQALARERALQVAVIGTGVPAIELAMAVAHALAAPHGSRVTLIAGDAPLLADQAAPLQRRVLARRSWPAAHRFCATRRCWPWAAARPPGCCRPACKPTTPAACNSTNACKARATARCSWCPTTHRLKSAPRWRPTCAPPSAAARSRKRPPMCCV